MAAMLTRYLRHHFPALEVQLAAIWPGLIGVTKDFAPVVGRHADLRGTRFAGAAAGLPWAAALGAYLAEQVVDGRDDLDAVLSVQRRFRVGAGVNRLVGTAAAFAVAHGLAKTLG
jgi:glycine/D-amino acid oxidase-like deaminating enzyme